MMGFVWHDLIRPAFVDDVKAHLRRYSVFFLGALASLQAAWMGLAPEIKALLPEQFIQIVSLVLAIGGLIGAFLKQNLEPYEFGLYDPYDDAADVTEDTSDLGLDDPDNTSSKS